jgi:hypothetical protein
MNILMFRSNTLHFFIYQKPNGQSCDASVRGFRFVPPASSSASFYYAQCFLVATVANAFQYLHFLHGSAGVIMKLTKTVPVTFYALLPWAFARSGEKSR